MATTTILETTYEFTSIDASDNVMVLGLTITKGDGFAPSVTELQIAKSLYNKIQTTFPGNTITLRRTQTTQTDDIDVA